MQPHRESCEVRWERFEDVGGQKVKLHGDYISVMLNPITKRVWNISMKWRK